ncbi:hypothetical protein [Paraclostridium bifermentans]|nr:hypothetical protein [Paraclostridium bifermentans]
MKENYEEDFYTRQQRRGLITVFVLIGIFVAIMLISPFLDISITFK